MTSTSTTWFKSDAVALSVIGRLGGATSKPLLVECICGSRFAVKFPNATWRSQLLVNEFMAGLLLSRLGLPTPQVARITFGPDFQQPPKEPTIQNIIADATRYSCPLVCLGLNFAADYSEIGSGVAADAIRNLEHIAGAVVFDTWVFNQDARHFLGRQIGAKWHLLLFDNDGAFNRHDWCLHDRARTDMNCTPLADSIHAVLRSRDLAIFERYLTVLEDDSIWCDLFTLKSEIPTTWLGDLLDSRTCDIDALLNRVDKRRHRVRQILQSF
jgi:hypothetical protein